MTGVLSGNRKREFLQHAVDIPVEVLTVESGVRHDILVRKIRHTETIVAILVATGESHGVVHRHPCTIEAVQIHSVVGVRPALPVEIDDRGSVEFLSPCTLTDVKRIRCKRWLLAIPSNTILLLKVGIVDGLIPGYVGINRDAHTLAGFTGLSGDHDHPVCRTCTI